MATAQVVATILAFVAIKRTLIEQHKGWMVRSYVVTLHSSRIDCSAC